MRSKHKNIPFFDLKYIIANELGRSDPKCGIQAIKLKAPQFKALWLSDFKENMYSEISPSLETVLKTLSNTKADGFCSSKNIISEPFIKSVIKEGFEYHVWTVDDIETARRFKKWGAKSIITNKPGYLRENLIKQMK